MITDSYSKMISGIGMRSVYGGGGAELNVEEELGLNIFRSGSAPPTVEGSLVASGGLLSGGGGGGGGVNMSSLSSISEEEIRSDPAYVSYYYSNVNRNPRLPPPLLSKEDWRLSQRVQGQGGGNRGVGVGGIGDRRKMRSGCNGGGREDGRDETSLFSLQPSFGGGKEENGNETTKEWGGDGLIGLTGLGLGTQKSIAEMIQVKKIDQGLYGS